MWGFKGWWGYVYGIGCLHSLGEHLCVIIYKAAHGWVCVCVCLYTIVCACTFAYEHMSVYQFPSVLSLTADRNEIFLGKLLIYVCYMTSSLRFLCQETVSRQPPSCCLPSTSSKAPWSLSTIQGGRYPVSPLGAWRAETPWIPLKKHSHSQVCEDTKPPEFFNGLCWVSTAES